MRAPPRAPLLALALLAWLWLPATRASAIGTAAGTDITNVASATYIDSGSPVTVTSAPNTVTVQELLDVDVTLQTVSPVSVAAGDANRVLAYLVTNTGNGIEDFSLAADSALVGDDFDPALAGVYLDANGNASYDAGTDPLHVSGVNDPVLDANTPGAESITVFVLNDIPLGPLVGELGNSDLTAAAGTGSGAPGTEFPGAGDAGTDALVGPSGAAATDLGSYLISGAASVSVVKSALVDDGFGGNTPAPGSTITYTLSVTVSGGTALSVVITDPVPANTTYVPNSLTLNASSLTDVGGDDAGDFNVTNPGEITTALGDLDSASPQQDITFQVTID